MSEITIDQIQNDLVPQRLDINQLLQNFSQKELDIIKNANLHTILDHQTTENNFPFNKEDSLEYFQEMEEDHNNYYYKERTFRMRDQQMENRLITWCVEEAYKNQQKVTWKKISEMAKEFSSYKEHFNASQGWLGKFFKRQNISSRMELAIQFAQQNKPLDIDYINSVYPIQDRKYEEDDGQRDITIQRSKYRKFDDEFKQNIVDKFKRGITINELVKEYDIQYSQVKIWLKKANAMSEDEPVNSYLHKKKFGRLKKHEIRGNYY